jgi:hypothetical protein
MRRGYLRYEDGFGRYQGIADYHRISAYVRQLAKEMHRPFITVSVDGYFEASFPNRKYLEPIMAPLIMMVGIEIQERMLVMERNSSRTVFNAKMTVPYRADIITATELPFIKRWLERLDTDPAWRKAMRADQPWR